SELRCHLIPLGQRRSRQTMDQEDGQVIATSHLPHQELVVAHEHGAAGYSQRVLLRWLETRVDTGPEHPEDDPAHQQPGEPSSHRASSPTANTRSSTGRPPIRCSSITLSSLASSRPAYQVPSG